MDRMSMIRCFREGVYFLTLSGIGAWKKRANYLQGMAFVREVCVNLELNTDNHKD